VDLEDLWWEIIVGRDEVEKRWPWRGAWLVEEEEERR
jgi:hypothetical protein